ncbi:SNF2-related protein [Maridesulfovibrio ferrireducens]|uniref:SNF2-related protein n=1 Tax=Maridesulfovibrio ferrireducens TaxID=246191 RepID=UPI001A2B4F08|nr:SNF2-related protein [Maridesulfovibrio ferrireducens]MBI9113239.1 restriction endonuclease [Maridesulfovibrio ferrireducens]
MLNKIKSLLAAAKDDSGFEIEAHPYGISFKTDQMQVCRNGKASQILQLQFVTLRIMTEQSLAAELENGFDLVSEDVVRLSHSDRLLLGLPEAWPGEFRIEFNGLSTQADFFLNAGLVLPSGDVVRHFYRNGPMFSISEQETYLPDQAQWLLLNTIEQHSLLSPDDKNEQVNLLAVKALQKAESMGAAVNLSHFEDLVVNTPDGITFSANQLDDGSLELLPSFRDVKEDKLVMNGAISEVKTNSHEICSPEDIEKRLSQLENGKGIMRVNNTLVVLNGEQIDAVEEILSNRTIPANQVRQFLESPGAFLDASKIDFDLGFSLRVKGVVEFEPAYFGETDSSETDWTGCSGLSRPPAILLHGLVDIVKTEAEVDEAEKLIKAARADGKRSITVNINGTDQEIILGDDQDDEKYIDEAKQKLRQTPDFDTPSGDLPDNIDENLSRSTVDIIREDEEHELDNKLSAGRDYYYAPPLRLTNCKRTPFDYQEKGIRWLLGLATNNGKMNWETDFVGGLLADDMGLGKTFMSLAAAIEYADIQREHGQAPKPCLVVAPLSLLQNWKDELTATYDPQPFDDVILLQSQEDLPRFRARKGNEVKQRDEDIASGLDALRYALKVGPSWGPDRLDQPNRLVLATYQVLREYQFSLCRVDWGFVIFDEAQNIKNPNTLQTRAAKGLKADMMVPATGTPVENSLADFWCLFDTACPGILKNYQDFRKKYVTPIRSAPPEKADEVRVKVGKDLRDMVGKLMLRRTKEDELEGIPEKHVHYPEVEMFGQQRKLYEAVLGSANIRDTDEPRGPSVLKALHSLRDVSLHPALLNSGQPMPPCDHESVKTHFEESGKLKIVLNILAEIKSKNEKVIIFVLRHRLQAYISMALGAIYGLNVNVINGTTKTSSKKADNKTRMGIIREFEAKEGFNILIMSPIAAGVGLTVVGANNVIHLERHWNPAKEAQATDRVYRIGQQKDVHVHIPILTHPEIDSFDVHLNRLLNRKLDIKDAVITPVEAAPEDLGDVLVDTRTPSSAQRIQGADIFKDMSWESFESLSALVLAAKYGGEPTLTAHPNDWGADSIIISSKQVILIQSKYSSEATFRSEKAVREVYGAVPKYEKLLGRKIDKLIVTTSSSKIDKKVKDSGKECGVEILSGKDIIKFLDQNTITYERVYGLLNSKRFPG